LSRLRVLLVDYDPVLLPLRRNRLRTAGFRVVAARHAAQAKRHFERGQLDLVVLTHSIERREREFIAESMKRRQLRVPILVLHGGVNESDVWADAFANGLAGTDALLIAVHGVLASNGAKPDAAHRARAA
jgi:DNA-binding response OmpR family regulator